MPGSEKAIAQFTGPAARMAVEVLILLTIGAAWAYYRSSNHTQWTVGDGVEDCFKAFFFVGYLYNYFLRVVKSSDDKKRHAAIIAKQEGLLEQLKEATKELAGHASGGTSVGWLMITHPQNGIIQNITAHVHGKYPLIDARAHVVDLDLSKDAMAEVERTGNIHDFFKHHVHFVLGNLPVNQAILQNQVLKFDTRKTLLRYRIDWTARNGTWTQYVQLKHNGELWSFFTAVHQDDTPVYENPALDHPTRADGSVDLFWHHADELA